ncbi:hypothetical protein P152DRAFT_377158, partial [Eremomyces bilateralis CBS 781.70]
AEAKNKRNREIAVHHARLIQAQKDAEARILESIEELIEFPLSKDADPANPAASDLQRIQTLLAAFQPSDFDDLLEERRCADLCAYVLCPRQPRRQLGDSEFDLVWGVADMKILPHRNTKLWCSPECAKRAIYIKVQLIEEPVAFRKSGATPPISILKETSGDDPVVPDIRKPTADRNPDLSRALAQLALERGDKISSTRATDLMQSDIVEKPVSGAPAAPTQLAATGYGSIEGYIP